MSRKYFGKEACGGSSVVTAVAAMQGVREKTLVGIATLDTPAQTMQSWRGGKKIFFQVPSFMPQS